VLPPGQSGEIVVTHLATRDYPFIRYRTGDVGVLGQQACACGRGLPVLSEIQGRSTDFVIAADGTVMHGLALIYVLRDIPGVASFKIVQESLDLTTVYVVPGPAFQPDDPGRIASGLRRRLGEAVVIDVKQVDVLPAEASGKFRYVVSRVAASVPAGR
ncbi:MAG: phenylacetate--CoA ligase family protein, partial [Zoogloea sp.]